MSPTVHALRNEIRVAVGRFERRGSTSFTKEALAAICAALDADIDTDGRSGKGEMRRAIREAIGELDGTDSTADERAFRKAELEAIATALRSR